MPPPAPHGPSPLAGALGFARDAPGFLTQVARTYGDVAALPIGPLRMVLVNDPRLIDQVLGPDRQAYVKAGMARGAAVIGNGLLISEGELHDRQRQRAQSAFAEPRLAAYLAAVPAIALAQTKDWSDGTLVDL